MASAIPIGQKSELSQGPASCSVCLEVVEDVGERSIAKLACGHHFHLDCIGSAFNAKGTMQCPNCRQVEDGLWLYANGCRQREDPLMADILNEDEFILYDEVSELLINDLMHFDNFQWCPYRSSYTQFSRSPGDADHPRAAYADVVVNVLFNDHLDHEAGQVLSPPQGLWPQWTLTPSTAPNSAGSNELGFLRDGQRWPQSDADSSQALGRSFSHHTGDNSIYQRPGDMVTNTMGTHNMVPLAPNHTLYAGGFVQMSPPYSPYNASHSRRRRVPVETPFSNGLFVHYPPEGQMPPGSLNLNFVGTSAVHNATVLGRQQDGTAFSQWRHEGWPPTFLQYPLEPEVRRWVLPPAGSHGLHNFYGSDLSTQGGSMSPEVHFANQFQGPFQAFLAPFNAGPQVNIGSFQPQTSINSLTR